MVNHTTADSTDPQMLRLNGERANAPFSTHFDNATPEKRGAKMRGEHGALNDPSALCAVTVE
jgi:hypothetical protein